MASTETTTDMKPNPVRRATLIVLGIVVVLFVYYLIADRLTPYTNQAYVQAFIVNVSPEVAGTVTDVQVRDNQGVKEGGVLFRIDPTRLDIAVRSAEAALALAGQGQGVSTAQVSSAQAKLSASEASLINVREQTARTFDLIEKKVYAEARRDQAQATLKNAEEEVNRARSDLEAARQQLGPRGADNPQIRAATADLEKAQVDLARSVLRAPTDGVVTNLKLNVGQYVPAGSPVLTFIDARNVWIVAEIREKSLANIREGNRADVALAGSPGEIFPGRILSVGWGVSTGTGGSSSGLPTISDDKGWGKPAQRFPVLIAFDERPDAGTIRVGSRAVVAVYTGNSLIMNAIAAVLIRVVSWFGYVY
jgi:multidrug resistance efflux pump